MEFQNRADFADNIVRVADALRGESILWHGRTPNGWRAYLTSGAYDHARVDNRRTYLTEAMVARCVAEPHAIFEDLRPGMERHYFAVRRTAEPHGRVKIKCFMVPLKKCQKMLFIPAYYVCTALRVSKLPRQRRLIWSAKGNLESW